MSTKVCIFNNCFQFYSMYAESLKLSSIRGTKSKDKTMEQNENKHRLIEAGVKEAVALAIERHKRLGESIAIWKDGQVVIVPPEEIPSNSGNC